MRDRESACYKKYDRRTVVQPYNAYLTVYLALCLAVILSLFLTLIDGVRRNGARLEAECITEIGLQSIMAEYHRELMKQYNLFAIDSSYGTATCGKANTEAHLMEYLSKNLSYDGIFLSDYLYRDFLALKAEGAEVTKASILTDYDGAVFRRNAVDAVKADIGLDLLGELQSWMQKIEINGLEEGDEEEKKQALEEEIGTWIEENEAETEGEDEGEIEEGEWETPAFVNPTDGLEAKKRMGILRLVIGDEAGLSQKALHTENLIMGRMQRGQVNQGNMELSNLDGMEEMTERFLFQEYLLRYMGRYGGEHEEDALHYQIEYLIAGKESDVENLRSVANRLCVLREAANFLYLMSDEVKKNEVRVLATTVCSLLLMPALIPLLESVILLGWAYAESVYDVKSLFAGGKVPLFKDSSSWHYSLTAALEGSLQDQATEGEGLSYQDYLRIFMMLTESGKITARAMNMVEADIRKTPGNAAFRLDGCYEKVEACVRIGSAHGFRYEITRQKNYN